MKHMINWRDVNALYQIYPRSFNDTNGDGVGDLQGVIEKLDYLKGQPESLGVDAIWLSPFYKSPMKDFGYDISDMKAVDPVFGTMEDFRKLVHEAHKRDIKVMVDFVPNHTSNEHEWFVDSLSSTQSAKRDYYVWRDPAPGGGPPNNWLSLFGGSAWEYDHVSGQYYLHSFLKEQPDLNWDNPKVREEMHNVLRYWLDLGVDGFRADAVWCISKNPDFADNPINKAYEGDNLHDYSRYIHKNSKNGPSLFKYLDEMTYVLAEYYDKRLIFEYYPDHQISDMYQQFRQFYTDINHSIGVPFNFEGIHQPWNAQSFGEFIEQYQKTVLEPDSLPVYCFGNHDQMRMVNRFGKRQARMIALMELTLPGLPTIYNGDEIGMEDGVTLPHQVRDPSATHEMGGRDPQRTPMQWDATKNAGFTTGEPWLPVAPSYVQNNVAQQVDDDESYLSLYQMLLHLRRIDPVLVSGSFDLVDVVNDMLVYQRSGDDRSYLVVLNFSHQSRTANVPVGDLLFMTNSGDVVDYTDAGELTLKEHSAVLIKL